MPRPTAAQLAKHPKCPRCGKPLVPTDNDDKYNDYTWLCKECDEDFFDIEAVYPDD